MSNFKNKLVLIFASSFVVIAVLYFTAEEENNRIVNQIDLPTFPNKAAEFEWLKRRNPETGKVPPNGRWEAFKYLKEQGKIPANYRNSKPNSFKGPWVSVDDFFSALSITRIAYDPNNTKTFYFSTGEGWYNADAVQGAGVWKSTNGGDTWNQLSSTDTSIFYHCLDMAVHPITSDIYVGTRAGGLQRSQDGGSTWEKVLGKGVGSSKNSIGGITFTATGSIFVGIGVSGETDGIYFSETGDKDTWTKQTNGLLSSGYYRILLATAPSNDSVLYSIFQGTSSFNSQIRGLYKTIDKGNSWFEIPDPGGDKNFARRQGWYYRSRQIGRLNCIRS